ncbi:RdgB/HAM1 family non-canonical purine NTP pyrophosphatase [Micrococcoides hystricis]|uniref:dITP/XTP pyrophosphatase n=1 Tax=Micrococcoides hystricis TaxID=1572761 RepID=A0ABV6PBW7_9MICC
MPMSSEPRIILATKNQGKLAELRQLLADVVPAEQIVDLSGFSVPDIVEDGVSFAENSALKATITAKATGLPVIADDSGLCVDVLGGAPGIFSARWSGTHGADRENYELLLAQLSDVKAEHRGAEFRCVATLATPEGATTAGVGVVRGAITTAPQGDGGFGYDPVFIPDEGQHLAGTPRSFAEYTAAEKNAISHRARALAELKDAVVATLSS